MRDACKVELAALDYQRGRLVRSWTHLERQRGGFGFLGGPGESQIEIDRRLIGERIVRIKRDLEAVEAPRARSIAPDARRHGCDGGAGGLHQRRQVDTVQSPVGRRT